MLPGKFISFGAAEQLKLQRSLLREADEVAAVLLTDMRMVLFSG